MRDSRKPARSTGRKWLSAGLILTLLIAAFVALIGSGGSSGDSTVTGGGGASGNMVSSPLGAAFNNILITPNTETKVAFTYTIPDNVLTDPITSYDGFMVNLDETMKSVSVTSNSIAMNETFFQKLQRFAWSDVMIQLIGIEKAMAAVDASVNVHISYLDDPDVCDSPVVFGPYIFSGDVGVEPASESETATTENAPPAIDVVASGTFSLCVIINPLAIPDSVYLSVDEVVIEAEPCELAPPADEDVTGFWYGSYSCENFGTGDEGGDVTLEITKNNDGSYSYIDDGGAMYNGHFCGNRFKHSGGLVDSYNESGTFVYGGNGEASKTSFWNAVSPGIGWGNCSDTLGRDMPMF